MGRKTTVAGSSGSELGSRGSEIGSGGFPERQKREKERERERERARAWRGRRLPSLQTIKLAPRLAEAGGKAKARKKVLHIWEVREVARSLARSERFWELLQANMVLGDVFVLWFVPAAAVVGILFALVQWYIVSGVSVGGEGKGNNGYLHVDEDGVSDAEVVAKCAEIQAAISEGAATTLSFCRGVCLEMNQDVVLFMCGEFFLCLQSLLFLSIFF